MATTSDCNCGCATCKCTHTSRCMIVDYAYVVDPDMPFSRKFNQNGTPEELVTSALRQAHDIVFAKLSKYKKCIDNVCEAIKKRDASNDSDNCPSPCLQALIDKLTRCIVGYAISQYVKDVGHDDFRNPEAEMLEIDKRIKLISFYEKEAEATFANEGFDDFILNSKKKDYDSNDNSDQYCFDCFARPSVDCGDTVIEEDQFYIPFDFT